MLSNSVLRVFLFTVLLIFINNYLLVDATPFQKNDLNENKLFFNLFNDYNSGLKHKIVPRQAEDDSEKSDSTTEASEPKSDKKSSTTPSEPLELDPDTETVTPNNTKPKLPEFPDLSDFPEMFPPLSPPGLFPPPGPSFFPGPFAPRKPFGPPSIPTPDFNPCTNPWALELLPDEGKKTKQDKLLSKMQCDFLMMQQKFSQFYKTVQNELDELKKLNYNTVARLARLESILRSASPLF
ncbi:uncharacterized protein LOC142327045 [Lycorma delicatula]|uniref:uncharacterized protein LOC142327045 n=1 Tax=Lycorma delicatula TaxID=130591 RepID=UPI003F51A79C